MPTYTVQSLAKLTIGQLKTLRENALTKGASEIVALCKAELTRRKPAKVPKPNRVGMQADGRTVHGFHFICPRELDVTPTVDGKFSTGIWAVSEAHLAPALAAGAYVALHESKSELSYRQGLLKGWRRDARPGRAIPFGITFLVEPNNTPLAWRGDGAGEKGYWYGDEPPGH